MAGIPIMPFAPTSLPVMVMTFLIGMLVGGFLGFMGYNWFMKMMGKKYQNVIDMMIRAPVIGIIDDVKENRREIVPLQPLKKGLYVSIDKNNPMVVFTTPATQPAWSFTFGKPIIYGISAGLYALAIDPKLFAPFGIVGLSLDIDAVKIDISQQGGLNLLKEQLLKKLGQQGTIEIPVGPDMKLCIAYDIVPLIRSLLSLISHLGNAVFLSVQETSQVALELAQYAQRSAVIEVAKKTAWYRFLIVLLILGVGIVLLFLLLAPHIMKMMPMMMHIARPV